MALISIKEYAAKHNKDSSAIRHLVKYDATRFKTLQKIGSFWVIDEDEPYPENANYRHGKYVGWYAENRRKKKALESRDVTPPE